MNIDRFGTVLWFSSVRRKWKCVEEKKEVLDGWGVVGALFVTRLADGNITPSRNRLPCKTYESTLLQHKFYFSVTTIPSSKFPSPLGLNST